MKSAVPCVLTINGGSSSIRFSVYEAGEAPRRRLDGKIDRIGMRDTTLFVNDPGGSPQVVGRLAATDHRAAAASLLRWREALGGLDTLVFAGGIGENAPLIRERICDGLGFLGIAVDQRRNAKSAPLISPGTPRVKVRVIRTDEEVTIARSVIRVLERGAPHDTKP